MFSETYFSVLITVAVKWKCLWPARHVENSRAKERKSWVILTYLIITLKVYVCINDNGKFLAWPNRSNNREIKHFFPPRLFCSVEVLNQLIQISSEKSVSHVKTKCRAFKKTDLTQRLQQLNHPLLLTSLSCGSLLSFLSPFSSSFFYPLIEPFCVFLYSIVLDAFTTCILDIILLCISSLTYLKRMSVTLSALGV